MTDLQAPILIVLDQVVIGIARESQWVEPQRIDRCRSKRRQPSPVRDKVRQVMAQDVVPDQMCGIVAERLETV
jgi:hypothetical protein